MSLEFTTAEELVDCKIQRNILLSELLEAENTILKNGILISYAWITHNEKKIKLLEKINEVEALQKNAYCYSRQDLISMMTDDINHVEVEITKYQERIAAEREKIKLILAKLEKINAEIPDQTYVMNYKIFVGGNCHGFRMA